MMKLITLAALLATVASPVLASDRDRSGAKDRPTHSRDAAGVRHGCSTKPAAEWMPIAEVSAKLQSSGFTVLDIEVKAGCYEARVTDDKGVVIELYLDAVTAEIVRRRERR